MTKLTIRFRLPIKRHRKVLRDNIQGITKPAIRRLARRGGVKRITETKRIYEKTYYSHGSSVVSTVTPIPVDCGGAMGSGCLNYHDSILPESIDDAARSTLSKNYAVICRHSDQYARPQKPKYRKELVQFEFHAFSYHIALWMEAL
ncbi:histone H2A [Clonorchis sinensis]|uniref:Histone H2A n=1 Tax=Clonorchis sinensis TaxID=79923 RepID=G7YSI5_CLOSI|nr:histone H2A [Clonorchis sinensis]